jgi:Ca2+/Na+ antiporter
MKIKSVHLLLFLLGLVSFACFFLLSGHPRNLILVGCLAWLSAYVGVLAKYYKRKAPLPTSMGWVEYEKRPVLYKLLYLWMLFVGVFAAAVSLLLTFVH